MSTSKWLIFCGALAIGEGLAAYFSSYSAAWPILVLFAILIALFGYGFAIRGWPLTFLFILGFALNWHANAIRAHEFRQTPWLLSAKRTHHFPKDTNPIRQDLARRINLGLEHSPQTAALNRSILLGERNKFFRAQKNTFAAAGTIHIFAISGLHVMIIARLLIFLAALCFIPIRFQGLITLPIIWTYVIIVNAPPSSVRAALMASIYLLAPLFWRRSDALQSWILAFLIAHILNPLQITNVGSQLSFAVMLGLIAANRYSNSWKSTWAKKLFAAAVVWAISVPITAQVFGRISVGALFSNIILAALVTYAVGAGALGVMVSFVSETVAIHLNNAAGMVGEVLLMASQFMADIPGCCVCVPTWGMCESIEWLLAFALGVYLLLRIQHRRQVV